MPLSLRSARIRFYGKADTVDVNGYPSRGYAFVAERWGAVAPASASERGLGGQTEHGVTIIVTVDENTAVDTDGIIKYKDEVYEVRDVLPVPRTSEKVITAGKASDAVYDAVAES